MFLIPTDYLTQIQPEIKTALSADPTIWSAAELQAQEEIESYLRTTYDVGAIFGMTGTARNARLVMIMVDIVLYHINSRITPRNIPEIREIRYEQAIDWLKAVVAGRVTPDLPVLIDAATNTPVSELKLGSNPKLKHSY
jgi:phage gp36-like protein